MLKKKIIYLVIISAVIFSACKKETEYLNSPQMSEFVPLEVGKYITYDLDSLIYINFGTKDTTIHYQVKHLVAGTLTDNLGRPGYRIIRYIRKNASESWQPDNTFEAVNTGKSYEFIENNMRFIKLMEPIKNNFSWKGNKYIQILPSSDGSTSYPDFSYLDDWDYTYEDVNQPLVLGSLTLDSCLVVNQRNEVLNDPDNPQVYSEINIGIEKYAKGIGMVYRKFFHREWQPPLQDGSGGYALGYGVTLTMTDHN